MIKVKTMRLSQNIIVAIIVGLTAAGIAFWKQAGADEQVPASGDIRQHAEIVVAGGCFWCVESDFDKVDGVLETISGYTGGHVQNPTYKQVSRENTGHYEAVRVIYDPSVVTYDELLDYYWRHVDPTDAGGQFCDRGDSYRTAIFVETDEEREAAEASKAALNALDILPGDIVTPIKDRGTFWPAEDYHQNYYKTHPIKYSYYRHACGRDKRVKDVWSKAES
jgi:peptide-methionine (S)-S-oxide reductase